MMDEAERGCFSIWSAKILQTGSFEVHFVLSCLPGTYRRSNAVNKRTIKMINSHTTMTMKSEVLYSKILVLLLV